LPENHGELRTLVNMKRIEVAPSPKINSICSKKQSAWSGLNARDTVSVQAFSLHAGQPTDRTAAAAVSCFLIGVFEFEQPGCCPARCACMLYCTARESGDGRLFIEGSHDACLDASECISAKDSCAQADPRKCLPTWSSLIIHSQ
jgi:hypothetical protein